MFSHAQNMPIPAYDGTFGGKKQEAL